MLKLLSRFILKLGGWTFYDKLPEEKKFVLIGAPHTTNWDLPMALLCFWSLQRKFYWVAKKQLFVGPFNTFFRALGGIPVDRSAATGFIEQIAHQFSQKDKMILAIAPEGTRSKSDYWKTGFYYIAVTAKVPVCLAYIDYQKKVINFENVLYPSGDINQDFEKIQALYKDKKGKYPENQGTIQIQKKSAKT